MLYYKYNIVSNRIWFDSKHHQTNIGSIVELPSFWIDLWCSQTYLQERTWFDEKRIHINIWSGSMRWWSVMVARFNILSRLPPRPPRTQNSELIRALFLLQKSCQIICLDGITFSALLNDGMTTYRSSHSTQFPFFLGSVQLIQFFLSFIFIFNSWEESWRRKTCRRWSHLKKYVQH